MGTVTPPRPLKADDDRAAFDCGRPSLNTWLQRHGWDNHVSGISRTNVICDGDTGLIAGYVSLSAAQIERGFLPKSQRRNKPDPIPVTLLGQLAVATTHQGQGHAKSLLAFALRSAVAAAEHVGSYPSSPIRWTIRSGLSTAASISRICLPTPSAPCTYESRSLSRRGLGRSRRDPGFP